MTQLYHSILDTIGNTPLVRINKLAPAEVNLYVKLEAFNPMGSVKDRLALGVIEAAERDGTLLPGQTVIEATSGNTGIGLAMVCACKGYPLVVTMAENFSVERRKMMRFLGAKVVLTPAHEKGSGMLNKAIELARQHGWFLCRQFENEANADMHSKTTAPEILSAFNKQQLDYWVTGYGTGGTLKGVARVLKQQSPGTRIIVCEPDNSPLLGSGIEQSRLDNGSPSQSHPNFRPHLMQGWTPDFISKLTADTQSASNIDELVAIDGNDALYWSKQLALQEGIFTGISGGATFAGAINISKRAPGGANIVCMLPDTGERYLSTVLFEEVSEEMTDAELEISKSTPGYRFDKPSAPQPAATAPTLAATPEAIEFLDLAMSDSQHKVVLFALEWCEFCWSLRKLFAKCGINYRSIDLDSAEYQQQDWGLKIRAALNEKTGINTIPQLFIGGEFIGGCSETFDAFNSGKLQKTLQENNEPYNPDVNLNAYELLPKWLQPR
ncbi:MAG: pyridoxal-phosphate dependent enzyme [Motiliproteus sp.]